MGGSDESDLELLTTTQWLHQNVRLKRAYFSAFSPIRDTPLENKAPTDPLRERRLYQASYLLRDYEFVLEDLPFTKDENLPLLVDPKLAWAQKNLVHQPVEVNRAEKRDLMRIPGIGQVTAMRIIRARQQKILNDLSMLKKLGVSAERAGPFILLNGKKAATQLAMF